METKIDPSDLAAKVKKGQRRALARAITLVESTRSVDLDLSRQVLREVTSSSGNSLRIGITGVPGAGKSTFIESLGKLLVEKGHKVAVLAVDPSSPYTGGSILGDKTRMQEISKLDRVFIRPSPTAGTLGGVSRKTRESILLCEAAGYDIILIETVGVGQSEFEVSTMSDFFLVLMLPNAGDVLQGIKRGILELADLVAVNKAVGENEQQAKRAASEYRNALHLVKRKHPDIPVNVTLCSALHHKGISEIWDEILQTIQKLKGNGSFSANRNRQLVHWSKRLTEELLLASFWDDPAKQSLWKILIEQIKNGEKTPLEAGNEMLRNR